MKRIVCMVAALLLLVGCIMPAGAITFKPEYYNEEELAEIIRLCRESLAEKYNNFFTEMFLTDLPAQGNGEVVNTCCFDLQHSAFKFTGKDNRTVRMDVDLNGEYSMMDVGIGLSSYHGGKDAATFSFFDGDRKIASQTIKADHDHGYENDFISDRMYSVDVRGVQILTIQVEVNVEYDEYHPWEADVLDPILYK